MVKDRAGRPLTVGIVGAGRSRNGLGPFLARDGEAAGLRLFGIAGRDPARTGALAESFARQFGHPVQAHGSAAALAQSDVDALVVATPAEHHLEGLEAALAAGLACLCEKPLVAMHQFAAGRALVAAFAMRGLLLAENCPWPFALPAFDRLFPGVRAQAPPTRVAMGLSPSMPGPGMVPDSLSHVLSVAQAVLPADAGLRVERAELADRSAAATQNVLRAGLRWAGGALELELHLLHRATQPRPAWLAIDGRRMDRRIGEGYAISFAGGGREVAAADPLPLCVAAFARLLAQGDRAGWAASTDAVAERLELYAAILAAVGLA